MAAGGTFDRMREMDLLNENQKRIDAQLEQKRKDAAYTQVMDTINNVRAFNPRVAAQMMAKVTGLSADELSETYDIKDLQERMKVAEQAGDYGLLASLTRENASKVLGREPTQADMDGIAETLKAKLDDRKFSAQRKKLENERLSKELKKMDIDLAKSAGDTTTDKSNAITKALDRVVSQARLSARFDNKPVGAIDFGAVKTPQEAFAKLADAMNTDKNLTPKMLLDAYKGLAKDEAAKSLVTDPISQTLYTPDTLFAGVPAVLELARKEGLAAQKPIVESSKLSADEEARLKALNAKAKANDGMLSDADAEEFKGLKQRYLKWR